MHRRKPPYMRLTLAVAAVPLGVLAIVPVESAGLEHLATEPVVLGLLSAVLLLLLGVVVRFREYRIALERKAQALEKSELHIRLMGDNLPNVTTFQLTYSEAEGMRFSQLSKGYERVLGFGRAEALADARQVLDRVYEADVPLLEKTFRQSRDQLAPADFELRMLDANGKLKWLHVSAVPHCEGEVTCIWNGFMQDISVAKQNEDTLLAENRNFHNLFETIDDFLFVCDMNGRLVHANPAVERRLGYSREQLLEMSLFELYPEETRPAIYQMVARMQSEPSTTCGHALKSRHGDLLPVEMSVFHGSWQSRPCIFGVARDVASRQQAENALRESQQMLQLIMDTIPMSVFWKDKDSVYLGCNQAFIRECGFQEISDVVGKTPFDLFPQELALASIERDQEVIVANAPVFNVMQSQTCSDGTIGWREISKIPLRDELGEAVGVLGVWRDVTEQNRAEERLKRTLDDMERFNQLMRGRERRTLELKAEINTLLRELGRPKKYRTTTDGLS